MPGTPAMYLETFQFGSPAAEGFGDLVNAARDVMANLHMTDIRTDVGNRLCAGRTLNSHCAIAYIGGTSRSTNALVTTSGDDAFAMKQPLVAGLKDVKFL